MTIYNTGKYQEKDFSKYIFGKTFIDCFATNLCNMHTWLLKVVNVCDNDQENKRKHIGQQEIFHLLC
jgi:hypothetical protein